MGVEGIGARVVRKEDKRFITGKGRYVDDIKLQGMTHAHFIRSPHAHAKVKKIDSSAALNMPGVVAVLTGQQIVDDKVGNLICGWAITSKDGSPMKMGAWPAMAPETVRFVGQAVAVVIADSKNLARDAAEAVVVDYEELPAVADIHAAIKAGAAQLHPEAPGNQVYDWVIGDEGATDAAFAKAANVVKLDVTNNRLAPNAMEPRAAIADYDAAEEHFTLYTTSQNPHVARLVLSAFYNIAPEHKLRVIAPDVGGGFGSKIFIYPEEMVALWASKKVGRPVKWTGDRTEAFLTDAHGRDHVTHAEMAFDANNKITGLKVKDLRQFRRLHVAVLLVGPDLSLRDAAVGPVQHPGDPCRGGRGLHQHHAGRRLSRRRPPRGELFDRAADGDGGAAAQGRSGSTAPEQLHHPVPAPDACDHGL
ncbi:CO/xanthine dehydrogenase Mo-binding subunit [Bradyrhizobium sp. S3.14.4]